MTTKAETAVPVLSSIGIDIGKDVFHLVDFDTALRPNLRFVKEKRQEQLDLQACHRVRSRLVSRRTATINQIR